MRDYHLTRPTRLPITENYGDRFGAVWADVSERVSRRLRQRGVDVFAADDALQEAATRALARRVAFSDADDLARWVWVVAWRSAVDARRRDRRIDFARPADSASPVDLEQTVFHRLAIDRVGKALLRMNDRERDALFPDVERWKQIDRRAAVREAVRRFRTRAKLAALVEGLLGVLGWLARVPRAASRQLRTVTGFTATGVAAVSVIAVLGLVPRAFTGGRVPVPPRAVDARGVPRSEARPTTPSATDGASGSARAPTTGTPSRRPPYARVSVPRTAGAEAAVTARPTRPDDHLFCTDLPVTGNRCVGSPLPLDKLPVPLP